MILVETGRPTEALHQLTDWALRRGTALAGLTVDRPSLEDVYLRLTSDGALAGAPERTFGMTTAAVPARPARRRP